MASPLTDASNDPGFIIGGPPRLLSKVIHLNQCNAPLRVIEGQLRRNAVQISEFQKHPNARVLAIRFLPGAYTIRDNAVPAIAFCCMSHSSVPGWN